MRQAHSTRFAALLAVVALSGGTGCIHNHYYGYVPAQQGVPISGVPVSNCDPGPGAIRTSSAAPRLGEVCEVPAGSGGSMVVQAGGNGSAAPSVSRATVPGRVLVSRPIGSALTSRPFSWRRSTENVAQTHVEGAYDDDTVLR